MKKLIIMLSFLFSVMLCGYNNVDELGCGDKPIQNILSPDDFEGVVIDEIKVPNETLRQERIYKASVGSEVAVGGANSGLSIGYWDQYTNWFIYDQLSEDKQNFWHNLDILFQPYLSTNKNYVKDYALASSGFESYNELFSAAQMYLYCHPQYYFLKSLVR